ATKAPPTAPSSTVSASSSIHSARVTRSASAPTSCASKRRNGPKNHRDTDFLRLFVLCVCGVLRRKSAQMRLELRGDRLLGLIAAEGLHDLATLDQQQGGDADDPEAPGNFLSFVHVHLHDLELLGHLGGESIHAGANRLT